MLQTLINWLFKRSKQQADTVPKVSTYAPNMPEQIHLQWQVNEVTQVPAQFNWHAPAASGFHAVSVPTPSDNESHAYDSQLLDKAHTQWQFGDWAGLVALQRDSIETHPERARLALLVAAGHQQVGDMSAARDFVQLARDWGCDKHLISRVLVAGVYNTLGKAALIQNDTESSKKHFRSALEGTGSVKALDLLIQARQEEGLRLQKTALLAPAGATIAKYALLAADEIFLKFRTITLTPNHAELLLTSTTAWQTMPVLPGAHYCIEGKIIASEPGSKQALTQIEFLDEENETIFFESSGLSKSNVGYYQYIDIKKAGGCRFFVAFTVPANCFIIRLGFRTWGDHSNTFYLESRLDLTINTNHWLIVHEAEDYRTAVRHYKQATRLLDQKKIVDAVKLFKQAEVLAPQLSFPYHLMRKLGVYNTANLSCLNENQQYSNPWAITEQLFITILSMLPVGATILELGSGTGTQELARYYRVISIEHDPVWLNKSPSHYIHAPLVDDYWYDSVLIAQELKLCSYDLLLIDGPPQHRRAGIIDHFDLFAHDVPIIFDDIIRDEDAYVMNKIAEKLKRTPRVYLHGQKGFAVI